MRRSFLAIPLLLAACGGAQKPEPIDDDGPEEADRRGGEDEEEEEDDGMELVSTRGKMAAGDVEAGIAPHAETLQDCYLALVGKRKWLGGKVELKWEISGEGELTSTQIVTGDLGAWPIEKCLLAVSREMTFAPPSGGDADFTVPLEFSARGSAQWWDEDKSAAVVSKRTAELAACATTAGVAEPANVMVTVYVGTRGKVQSAGFSSPAPIDEAWAQCAHDTIAAWTLTDPKGAVAKLGFLYNPQAMPDDDADDGGGEY